MYSRGTHPRPAHSLCLTPGRETEEADTTTMFARLSKPTTLRHLLVCLLLLVALLSMSIVTASHFHTDQDAHEGQCALCMSCAQMVAYCVAAILLFFISLKTYEAVFEHESVLLLTWIPPSQRVRPPPVL